MWVYLPFCGHLWGRHAWSRTQVNRTHFQALFLVRDLPFIQGESGQGPANKKQIFYLLQLFTEMLQTSFWEEAEILCKPFPWFYGKESSGQLLLMGWNPQFLYLYVPGNLETNPWNIHCVQSYLCPYLAQ